MRSPDAGSATVGGTFPDDPPRPAPLMVPETAPEWSPAELERYLHVVAMERHAAHAIRRHDLMDRLHQHCDGVGNPNPLLLLGPPGSGKSTALATLMSEIEGGPAARRRRDSASLGGAPDGAGADTPGTSAAAAAADSAVAVAGAEPFVLAHTFGLLGHSDDLRRALLRMCAELKSRFNIYVDLPSRLEDVGTAFPRFLAHAALFGKIVVVLDGLDKAECHDVTPEDWLPAALPLAARVVVASAGCRAVNALKEKSGQLLHVLPVAPLDASERARMLDAALEGVGGERVRVRDAGGSARRRGRRVAPVLGAGGRGDQVPRSRRRRRHVCCRGGGQRLPRNHGGSARVHLRPAGAPLRHDAGGGGDDARRVLAIGPDGFGDLRASARHADPGEPARFGVGGASG